MEQWHGKFEVFIYRERSTHDCEGHEAEGSYRIEYSIKGNFIFHEIVPNSKEGLTQDFKAYLPGGKQGKQVLAVLIKVFEQRFTFCTARSMSDPSVIGIYWGKILHKSSRGGKNKSNGFPHPGYLNDVLSASRALGVSCDNEEEINKLVDNNTKVEVKSRKDGSLNPPIIERKKIISNKKEE